MPAAQQQADQQSRPGPPAPAVGGAGMVTGDYLDGYGMAMVLYILIIFYNYIVFLGFMVYL